MSFSLKSPIFSFIHIYLIPQMKERKGGNKKVPLGLGKIIEIVCFIYSLPLRIHQ